MPGARHNGIRFGRLNVGLLCLLLGATSAVALPLSGVVTSDGGDAIAGASVQIWPKEAETEDAQSRSGAPTAHTKTDERGRFALANVPAGRYRVAIEAPGFVPHDIGALAVPRDGALPPIRVALPPAVFIAGAVVDAKGEAVADAVVETERAGGRALEARADANGRFRMGPFAAGEEVFLAVHATGVGRVLRWEAVAPRDDLRIRIRGGGALRGRVTDRETGLPIADFHMTIAGPQGSARTRAKRFQSEDGVFVWDALPPGRFAATVAVDGYQLHTVPELHLPQDGADVDLPIAMNPGTVVRGRVVDAATGLPVAGALITAREGAWVSYQPLAPIDANKPFGIASTKTDAEGGFVLRQLPLEAVTVRVRATGYLSATAVAQPNETLAAIELSAGATLRGWLVDREGMATDGVVVLWYPLSAERRTTAATAEGGFAFEQVAEGRYRLWGHAAPAAERWSFEEEQAGIAVVVSPGDSVIETDVALDRTEGCDVEVTVRGLLAGESARVELTHFNRRRQRRQVAHADDAGRFALSVRAGAVRVRARTSAGRVLTRRVAAPCAADHPLDFHFDGRSRLYGTVTRRGEPVRATVRVQALAQNAEACGSDAAASNAASAGNSRPDCPPVLGASAATSPSGQYAIRGLRPGAYALEVVGTGHRREARVARDTRVDIQLRDDEREVDFAGVVTAADTQQPLPGVYVSLRLKEGSADFDVIARRTDSNGAFAMRLTPGKYRLFANKTGFAPQWRDQDILETTTHPEISLAAAAGARVRVTDAETGQPLPYVALGVADQGIPLRLTAAGTANLWRDLEGQDLLFRHPNYEDVLIHRWDGAPLEIQMRGHADKDEQAP